MRWRLPWLLVAWALFLAVDARAADSVVGTLTVKGKTVPLRYVIAAIEQDPESEQKWLVVLVSDVAVAEADCTPSRLAELAAVGKLQAVRVVWREGFDAVHATPYHPALSQSGRLGSEHPTINLDRYDGKRFEGYVKSKMLGQDWFFEAHVKTDLRPGGTFELEPEAEEPQPVLANAGRLDDPAQKKRALGKLGYEYNVEMFAHAVQDAKLDAVRLFLEAGMSPNTPESSDRQPLDLAVTECAYEKEPEAFEMVKLLLKAGAKVEAGAKNGITPLLHAAQHCAGPEILKVLIEAGANVNTKAPGGATPLMFAKIFNRKESEALLRRAGARD